MKKRKRDTGYEYAKKMNWATYLTIESARFEYLVSMVLGAVLLLAGVYFIFTRQLEFGFSVLFIILGLLVFLVNRLYLSGLPGKLI